MKMLSIEKLPIAKLMLILLCLCVACSAANAQETEADINARITALTAKINTAPKDDSLYAQRGMAYFALSKLEEALADANTTIGINPKNTNALFLRGQIKGIKKDYDGAIADYTLTINTYPKPLIRAHLKRGEMYEMKGDKEKARADYVRALEISPQNAPATESLARVGGAAANISNATSSGKTSESSPNNTNQINKQNPNVGGSAVATSINRRNFYIGWSFNQSLSQALFIDEFGRNDKDLANLLLAKLKVLYPLLRGRAEAEDLAGTIKKLQQSKDIKVFISELKEINSKYKISLATEQKWYFDIGYTVANVQFGIASKNHYLFIGKNDDFSKIVKSLPAGTPASLQISLTKLSQYANSNDLSAVESDSAYAALLAQINPIFDSIGKLTNEDIN